MAHKLTTYGIIGLLLVVAFLAGCISTNEASNNMLYSYSELGNVANGKCWILTYDKTGEQFIVYKDRTCGSVCMAPIN